MRLLCGSYLDEVGDRLSKEFEYRAKTALYGPYSALGWEYNSTLQGIAVFVEYTGSNVDVHLQNNNSLLNRTQILHVYKYVFQQLKCNRLTAKPYSTNEKLLQLLPRMGFVYECTMKAYYGSIDDPIDAVQYYLPRHVALEWIKNAERRLSTSRTRSEASNSCSTAV